MKSIWQCLAYNKQQWMFMIIAIIKRKIIFFFSETSIDRGLKYNALLSSLSTDFSSNGIKFQSALNFSKCWKVFNNSLRYAQNENVWGKEQGGRVVICKGKAVNLRAIWHCPWLWQASCNNQMIAKEKWNDAWCLAISVQLKTMTWWLCCVQNTAEVWKVTALGEKHYRRLVKYRPQRKINKLLGSRGSD